MWKLSEYDAKTIIEYPLEMIKKITDTMNKWQRLKYYSFSKMSLSFLNLKSEL